MRTKITADDASRPVEIETPLTRTPQKIHQPATGHTAFRNRKFFGSLNGLRALSVVAVIWHHTAGPYKSALPMLMNGHHGVTLFFAISGFLIVTLLLRERETSGQIDLTAFYIRRSLRIFPLYYAVITIYIFLVIVVERGSPAGKEFFQNLPFFLTYTSNWFVLLEGRVIFYFAWSLAAEEQFYLVWPTIQRYFTRTAVIATVLTVIVVVAATQLATSGDPPPVSGSLRQVVTSIPLAICFGVLLAHALHHRGTFDALGWLFASRASAMVWMSILLVSLSFPVIPELLVHASAVMFVGACIYREDHWLAPLLQMRGVVHIGTVSYGIYLLHMLVKNAVLRLESVASIEVPAFGTTFVLTVIGSTAAASVSYRYFESVFLRKKHKYAAV